MLLTEDPHSSHSLHAQPPRTGSAPRWLRLGLNAIALAALGACAAIDNASSTPTVVPQILKTEPALATVLSDMGAPIAPEVLPVNEPQISEGGEAYDPYNPNRNQNDPAQTGDLWQRMRGSFSMNDLADPTLVAQWEAKYANQPEYMNRIAERGGRYLYHIVDAVEQRGMPLDLALLPVVESAFVAMAKSSAKAMGIWQFMPATGRDLDLHQTMFKDDRRSVLASTEAALDYLQQLHEQFDDWHLALAAYNWGQGNVRRAIARNAAQGLPTNYESLNLPIETRNYVPKLLAVRNIVKNPQKFGLTLAPMPNHPYFLTVPITRDIDLQTLQRLAKVSANEFHLLNPEHVKPVIFAAGTPQILLPYQQAKEFTQAVKEHQGPLSALTAWVAPRTMKVEEVARTLGIDSAQVRQYNQLPARMMVRAGSTLIVPSNGIERNVSGSVLDKAHLALTPEPPPVKRVVFRANRLGISVADAALHAGVSATQIAQWNNIGARGRFSSHANIVVFVPPSRQIAAIPEPPPPPKPVFKRLSAKDLKRLTPKQRKAYQQNLNDAQQEAAESKKSRSKPDPDEKASARKGKDKDKAKNSGPDKRTKKGAEQAEKPAKSSKKSAPDPKPSAKKKSK